MSNLFCERKTKWIGLTFWLLFWADLEAKALGEQYESMSVEEKMKGIVYER